LLLWRQPVMEAALASQLMMQQDVARSLAQGFSRV
jgi:hypothetical protein